MNGATASGPAGGVTAWTRDARALPVIRCSRRRGGVVRSTVSTTRAPSSSSSSESAGPMRGVRGPSSSLGGGGASMGQRSTYSSSWSEPNEGSLRSPSSEKESSAILPGHRFRLP